MRNPPNDPPDIITLEDLIAATPEQRRRWLDQLFRQWEENRERELDEEMRADALRGHWGD